MPPELAADNKRHSEFSVVLYTGRKNNKPFLLFAVVTAFGNGVGQINTAKLRRARLAMGLVTTFDGSGIPILIQAHSAWPSLGGYVQCAGDVLRSSGPCYHDCWHTGSSRLKTLAVDLNRPWVVC